MTDSAPKRSHFQIQRDRQDIADWYCQGLTQAAIAERINTDPEREYTLTQQMISYDLKAIQKAWLESSLRDFDEMRAEQLGKIDRLEREYWRGWERSCEDAETVRKEGPASGVEKITKTEKGQAGDPRFLAGVERCIERRCKLLGLDAPEKRELTGRGGGPITFNLDGLSDDDLERIGEIIAKAQS